MVEPFSPEPFSHQQVVSIGSALFGHELKEPYRIWRRGRQELYDIVGDSILAEMYYRDFLKVAPPFYRKDIEDVVNRLESNDTK